MYAYLRQQRGKGGRASNSNSLSHLSNYPESRPRTPNTHVLNTTNNNSTRASTATLPSHLGARAGGFTWSRGRWYVVSRVCRFVVAG